MEEDGVTYFEVFP